ncbi:MAG TPA: EamA family transporter [Gammaproteobacteria bacterium]|nr:EamA family transporter [Gammaproteobacteria bacterium]
MLFHNNLKNINPNIWGITACLFWSLSPSWVCNLNELPPFETIFFMYLISFTLIAYKNYKKPIWPSLKTIPKHLALIGVVGICGNDMLYILSLKIIAPEHAELIAYLWPIFSLIGMSFFGKIQPKFHHALGMLLALSGIGILSLQDTPSMQLYHFNVGYLVAILGAIVWSVYNVFAKINNSIPETIFILIFGSGLIMSLLTHLYFESFILPSLSQLFSISLMGLTTHFLAYTFWDYSIKHGNFIFLHSFAYLNPLISISFLILFGYTQATILLWSAAILICLGCFIINNPFNPLRYLVKKLNLFPLVTV